MYIVFTFPTSDHKLAESIVPLLTHGKWIKINQWNNPITIIYMTGFQKISISYKKDLEDLGYNLIDATELSDALLVRYPKLKILDPYFRYTFLRWIVLKFLVDKNKITLPCTCIGGDVFFMSEPSKIFNEIRAKTFVLQGCPDFLTINNNIWLDVYESEFNNFIQDSEYYHLRFQDSVNNLDDKFCNDSCYQFPLRHDQDFIEFMIAKNILPQSRTEEVLCLSNYFWIQNPLFPNDWANFQIGSDSFISHKIGNKFLICNKEISILHLQNNFVDCLKSYLGLRKLLFPMKIAMKYALTGYDGTSTFFYRKVIRKIGKIISYLHNIKTREDVAIYIINNSNIIITILNLISKINKNKKFTIN
jgi:hypothetical protein